MLGCKNLSFDGYCEEHRKEKNKRIRTSRTKGQASSTKRGYDQTWKKYRLVYLTDHPLCVECERKGLLVPAEVVDHIAPHKGNRDLFWDENNHQALCAKCHNEKTAKELNPMFHAYPKNFNKSNIPVIVVCGPPASGKTTYVREHAGDNDIILDLDAIVEDISGLNRYDVGEEWIPAALIERNKRINALRDDTTHDRAWLIVTAGTPKQRKYWEEKLNAEVRIIPTSKEECIRRIKEDAGRNENAKRLIKAVEEWREG